MIFRKYDFIGLKAEKKLQIDKTETVYFIRDITESAYICDVYEGENHITNHYALKIDDESYEKKNVRALFRVTEFFPDRPQFNERTETFLSVEDIATEAPHWMISKIIILCDSDCKALGIDPAAPWPPKAA